MQTANPNRTRNVRLGSLLAGCISLLSSPALTRLAAQTPPLQVAQQAYLKTSITGANDYFGYAVAVSGDTVVVGAYGESSSSKGVNGDQTDNSAPGSGAAYVFVLSGTNWVQQAYLKASNAEAGDGFGYSVAVSGDTVVVGSPQEDSKARGVNGDESDNSSPGSGAVYVFVRSGTNWIQQAYLKASNAEGTENGSPFGDEFGVSVSVSSNTVVVGANQESSRATGVNGDQNDNNAARSGSAYIFVRNGTTWSQQAYLKASNTETFDYFGYAVAVSGDTVVVGAPLEDSQATGMNGDLTDNSAPNSGAVYVFVRNGTDWTQQAYLKASNTGASDYFGASVALSNDTLVVAAHQEDSGATGVNGNQSNDTAADSGAAYVFVRNGTNWSQQAYLKASNTGANDYFGISVALWGETLLVGAHLEASNATGVNGNQTSNSASESGAAYLFVRNGTNWTQQAYVKASNTGGGDNFGVSVGVSAGTMAIGAWYEDSNATGVDGNQNDNSATDSGAAYVFRVSPAGPPELHLSGVRDGNTFQLVASGTPSTQWRLEFRDTLAELSSWQPLTNSILSSSPVVVSQTFDGIQRFYRGTWVP